MSACRIPSLSLVVLIVLFTSGVALGQEVVPGAALTAAFTYQGSLQATVRPPMDPTISSAYSTTPRRRQVAYRHTGRRARDQWHLHGRA